MKEFDVTITATITKTIRVEADTEDEATEQAHQIFTVDDGGPEKYDQDTVLCEEVKEITNG